MSCVTADGVDLRRISLLPKESVFDSSGGMGINSSISAILIDIFRSKIEHPHFYQLIFGVEIS